MIIRIAALSALAILMGLGAVPPASARVTQIVINSRVPAYGGVVFPNTGAYEQLDGTAYYEVDPDDPLNRVTTDIKLAPRNARGNVEFSADISILKPVDMSKSNGVLLYEDVNRGNKNTPSFNIGGGAPPPGGRSSPPAGGTTAAG